MTCAHSCASPTLAPQLASRRFFNVDNAQAERKNAIRARGGESASSPLPLGTCACACAGGTP
jgi:hypothetical protein